MKQEKKPKTRSKRFKEKLVEKPKPNNNKLEENANGNLDPAFENNNVENNNLDNGNNNENNLERNVNDANNPNRDEQPLNDHIPRGGGLPLDDDIPNRDGQPLNDHIPRGGGLPLDDDIPNGDEQPLNDHIPRGGGLPLDDDIPNGDEQPLNDHIPRGGGLPLDDDIPNGDGQPLDDNIPNGDEQPLDDIIPHGEEGHLHGIDDPMEEEEEEKNIDEVFEYDEYYPVNRYAVDVKNNDRYAKKRTLDEFYLMEDQTEKYAVKRLASGDTVPFYARTKRNEPIFAKDKGQPVYPKTNNSLHVFPTSSNNNKHQVYMKLDNGREVYPENDQLTEMYATNENGDQYMAHDETLSMYYATKMNEMKERIEYVPENKDGKKTHIILPDGKFQYPMNKVNGYPVYEKNEWGEDQYLVDSEGNEYYGQNTLGKEVYGKTKLKNIEILAKNLIDNTPFYAKYKNGKEYYPTDIMVGQYYLQKNNVEIPAKDENGLYYYAKSLNEDEYYPRIY